MSTISKILQTRLAGGTLVDILRWHAHHQPDQRAYTFLKDGESEDSHLTYAQLDQKARNIAALLQEQAAVGDRALLLYQPGLEYIAGFFGCLYAGIIAVPAYPPSSSRSFLRIQAIAADAQAKVALTSQHVYSKVHQWSESLPATFQWVVTDVLNEDSEERGSISMPTSETIAFLQYTSGSTGTPKGVMVSHGNLVHNLMMMRDRWGCCEQSVGVSWLPIFHDMGLIAGILLPLYTGFPTILMAPASFMQNPMRWLQAISRYQGTISYAPNFAYTLCVQKLATQEPRDLDLRSWCVAINGAEPIRAHTLERFAETFSPYGFRRQALMPGYGLAEATLMVSCTPLHVGTKTLSVNRAALEHYHVRAEKRENCTTQSLVSCGPSATDQRIVIVDPKTRMECGPGTIGEIWVSGPSIAQGYWQRREETESTFHAFLAESKDGPFLRTGDLGFLHERELFVAGRLKDIIIICGRNYYPQDIETTAGQAHISLKADCGAAFSVEIAEEERLVIVQELDRNYRNQNLQEVFTAIQHAIWEGHKLQAHTIVLIKQRSIPKTSSGKIQRRACRQKFLEDELDVIEAGGIVRS